MFLDIRELEEGPHYFECEIARELRLNASGDAYRAHVDNCPDCLQELADAILGTMVDMGELCDECGSTKLDADDYFIHFPGCRYYRSD